LPATSQVKKVFSTQSDVAFMAERLRQRLAQNNLDKGVTVSFVPRSGLLTVSCKPDDLATIESFIKELDADSQKQRKLLELDLAEAKLGVEVATVELAQAEEIRKKNPAALSNQELRKLQLQIERAKIQVKRIEVQLEEAGKAADTSAAAQIGFTR